MKSALIPIAALIAFSVGCKPREFNSTTMSAESSAPKPVTSWKCDATGENVQNQKADGGGTLKIYIEKKSLTYVVDKDGALRQAIVPEKVLVDVVDSSSRDKLGKCRGKDVVRIKAALQEMRNISINGIGGTHVVGQKFTTELQGQTLFGESGDQFLQNVSDGECPTLQSVELNGAEKAEAVLFLRVARGDSQRVFTKCRQISDDNTASNDKDVCSVIKCH
ncbi:hypothetical protein EBR21_07350 [bacterium]|nr:hypothetical protein [bacterium]